MAHENETIFLPFSHLGTQKRGKMIGLRTFTFALAYRRQKFPAFAAHTHAFLHAPHPFHHTYLPLAAPRKRVARW